MPLAPFALSLLLGRRRSFSRDGRVIMRANTYPRRVEGLENVPEQGSFILTMNHYNRRGLRPQICAFIVSSSLAGARPGLPELAWVFAEELERFIYAPIPMPRWMMRVLFRRLARVYGFITMPREWRRATERASAMRRVKRALVERPVGLTPEGGGPGVLRKPPPGSGQFLYYLADGKYPILPVGIFEEEETLVVRIGPPFLLPVIQERDRIEETTSRAVMMAIGRLLPESYRGAYREELAGA